MPTVPTERSACWACAQDLSGPMSYRFQLDERWHGRIGSGIHVALCSTCARRVRALLYAIQEETNLASGQTGEGQGA